MAEDLGGTPIIQPEDLGTPTISNEIQHIYGAAAKKLTRPKGASVLHLIVESGTFRMRLGDREAGGLVETPPGAAVTNGTGSIKLPATYFPIAAPKVVTFKGTGATDILTYWWT